MKIVAALRLLLEVYGGLFLVLLVMPTLVYGVLPYEGLLRLGSVLFYVLVAVAFAFWAWLAAGVFARSDATPRDGSR